eukprot:3210975-Rhodomonas_salina.2
MERASPGTGGGGSDCQRYQTRPGNSTQPRSVSDVPQQTHQSETYRESSVDRVRRVGCGRGFGARPGRCQR